MTAGTASVESIASGTAESRTIVRPPTKAELRVDRAFKFTTHIFAWLTVMIVLLVVGLIGWHALPAIREQGAHFVVSSAWDAGKGQYGILPEIFGTMVSSSIGVAVGSLFGLVVAIFLTQEFIPRWLESIFKNIVTLLAAIPSVVYGLWGIFVVIPAIRPTCNWLHGHLGWIPTFSTPLLSVGMLPAALVLAIMILPTVTAISRDSLIAVNPLLREAAFGMGATRWETILGITLPTSKRGIYGSIVLGFGRAIGETMALAMLIGSSNVISFSVFSPADTLAALLANKFPEAASPRDLGVLMYAALALLGLTLLVNVVGELIIGPREFERGSARGEKEIAK
jgi:phosphate transport system permease protein